MRSSHQQIPQVAHGVCLDVVHVAQATKRRLVQRFVSEGVEVDVVDAQPTGPLLECGEVEGLALERRADCPGHAVCSEPVSPSDE